MRLPNAERGLVDREKIVDYLMNLSHPEGSGKARFFLGLGFGVDNWQALADALLRVAVSGTVAQVVDSVHGSKYIVDGTLSAPSGQTTVVRTVWIREPWEERPRLVTAYPKER